MEVGRASGAKDRKRKKEEHKTLHFLEQALTIFVGINSADKRATACTPVQNPSALYAFVVYCKYIYISLIEMRTICEQI